MRMIYLSIMVFGAFVSSSVGAQALDHEKDIIEAAFRQADTIVDDRLDAGEFDMYHLKIFFGLDKNDDGSLARDECYRGCFSASLDEGAFGREATENYIFEAVDEDNNKQAAENEYISYARKQFKDYDRNTDRFLDKEEFLAFYQGMDERAFFVKNTVLPKIE